MSESEGYGRSRTSTVESQVDEYSSYGSDYGLNIADSNGSDFGFFNSNPFDSGIGSFNSFFEDDFFGLNFDDHLVSRFKAAMSTDLSYLRPSSSGCLWVFWRNEQSLIVKAITRSRLVGLQLTDNQVSKATDKQDKKNLGTTYSDAPTTNPVIREKISNVLRHLQFSSYPQGVLVQFWAPFATGGHCFLSTLDQPFGISKFNEGLCAFRNLSQFYKCYADSELEKELNIISRVFVHKYPKLIPDVQTCSIKEYPQLDHVVRCNVHAFVALPVLEPIDLSCVGVIELVLTRILTDHYEYMSLILDVCSKLKAADLKSLFDSDHFQSLNVTSGRELEADPSLADIHTFMEKNFDSIQIDQATKSPPRTRGLQKGGTGQINSSFQPLVVEDDAINNRKHEIIVEDEAINNGNDVANNDNGFITVLESNLIGTSSEKEGKIKTSEREHTSITYEILEQNFGLKLEDAAEKLGVCRSTLKRLCRRHEIPRWPSPKRNKRSHLPSSHTKLIDTTLEDAKIATIKATYGHDIIRFRIYFSSGMSDLEEEVAKRLKLKIGTFRMKYMDEDSEWILIACDADLKDCMHISASLGTTPIRMLVELVTLS